MKTFTIRNIQPAIFCDACKKILRRADRYVIFEISKFPMEIDRVCMKCLTEYINHENDYEVYENL